MSESRNRCPIGNHTPAAVSYDPPRIEVDCSVCGTFRIEESFFAWLLGGLERGDLPDETRALLPRLSIAVRHAAAPPALTHDSYRKLAQEAPRFPIEAQLHRLLELLAERAPKGHDITIEADQLRQIVPIVTAEDDAELRLLMHELIERELIWAEWAGGGYGPLRLTIAGWKALEPPSGGVPGRCFVAMWFGSEMNTAFDDGFAKAIEDCGLEPRRIDKVPLDGKICDGILAEIRHAEVVIADFTNFRSGVFFEAGFALALDKMVVFTCRKDYFPKLGEHFDTRQYQHIEWIDPADLRLKLADHIRARRSVRPPA